MEAPVSNSGQFNYLQTIPDVLQTMASVHDLIDAHGLEKPLQHLVLLRASQINRCAYCVKMHTDEARRDGETSERLDRVIVWEDVDDFSDREKTALAWTEALTTINGKAERANLRDRLRSHFSDEEVGALTATIAMINLWNRIQVSNH